MSKPTDLSHYTKHHITEADATALMGLLGHGQPLTQGPMVEGFETVLCSLTGAPHAVVVNSGTAALELAYAILYPPGTVITMPAISFVATANAAIRVGLGVKFKDVSPRTGLVMEDCDVGVELGGQPTGHRHTVVDACHSFRYQPHAQVTILSFHPAKHIACGEGGAILTGNAEIADKARIIRSHGRVDGKMLALGMNARMPDLNACLGITQSFRVMENIAKRQALAALYDAAFDGNEDILPVPHAADSHRHLYQVRLTDRDRMRDALTAKGIGTAVHYPVIPDEPYYRAKGTNLEGLGWARDFARQTLSVPLFPKMTPEDVTRVVTTMKDCL